LVAQRAFYHVYAISGRDFFPGFGHVLVFVAGFDQLRGHLELKRRKDKGVENRKRKRGKK